MGKGKRAAVDGVVFVMLRRPRRNDPRRDPLYEFGCFGLTGCHGSNLLADGSLTGKRLAFAQGGSLGFRLVMLTPPITVRAYPPKLHAAYWRPVSMPFCYEDAPLLVNNYGESDVPRLIGTLAGVARKSWEAKFASKFRSRKRSLSAALARDIMTVWRKAARRGVRASEYWQALPYRPDVIDEDRQAVHDELLRRATGAWIVRSRRC